MENNASNLLKLEYRMYFLVPYNISEIQKGIQAGHAVIEYSLLNWVQPEFQKWAREDKTFIILNGGTFNDNENCSGTMNTALKTLLTQGIRVGTFREPDLNTGLSAIAFLVDERVYDKKKYPYPTEITGINGVYGTPINLISGVRIAEELWTHTQLQSVAGSYQNAFLRGFLQDYRLA